MLTISKGGLSVVGSGGSGDMSTANEGDGKDGGEDDLERHGYGRIGGRM